MNTSEPLNKLIHEQARLKILVLLASSVNPIVPFTVIRDELGLTAGNLSIQLKTLEEAEYVKIKKYICGSKPKTDICITSHGRKSLMEYINSLENLLSSLKE